MTITAEVDAEDSPLITPRERYLMDAAMSASRSGYASADAWLGEYVAEGGYTVEGLLYTQANEATAEVE